MTGENDAVSPEITVHKLDQAGRGVTSYPGRIIERLACGVKLEAHWDRPALALGYTIFETGDRFVEWFYSDRWYNIFAIYSNGGALKGWYCNVAEPARIADGVVACRDLLLDLWVNPDLTCQVLDEEEFAGDTTITSDERVHALQALEELRDLVTRRLPPFDDSAAR